VLWDMNEGLETANFGFGALICYSDHSLSSWIQEK